MEEEGEPKNDRNGRHWESKIQHSPPVVEVYMLSSMFLFPLLLDYLFLPLPGPPSRSRARKVSKWNGCMHCNEAHIYNPREQKHWIVNKVTYYSIYMVHKSRLHSMALIYWAMWHLLLIIKIKCGDDAGDFFFCMCPSNARTTGDSLAS